MGLYVGLGLLDWSIFIHPSIIERYGLKDSDEINVQYDICADTITRHPNIYDPTATLEDDCLSALAEQLIRPRSRLRKEILSHGGCGQHRTMREPAKKCNTLVDWLKGIPLGYRQFPPCRYLPRNEVLGRKDATYT